MKIMIDTNVLISAILFPNGKAAQALIKALTPPCKPYVCDYILDELQRKFKEKFPDNTIELEEFLFNALKTIKVVNTPKYSIEEESLIRDIKDRPILRATKKSKIEYLLTGDKDFLEANIDSPKVISVVELINM